MSERNQVKESGSEIAVESNPIIDGFLMADQGSLKKIADGVYVIGGQGYTVLVETERGLVITDSGPGGDITRELIEKVRSISEKPVIALVYSHGHGGYNYGARYWVKEALGRGYEPPEVIAHERVVNRFDRYKETWGLQRLLNQLQIRVSPPQEAPEKWFYYPTRTFREKLIIDGGDRLVEVLSAPSETDDAVALWLPDSGVLYAGPGFINSIPNVGTPLRTLRDPVRWADTLERLIALKPKVLIPEFGELVFGEDSVSHVLKLYVDALCYLRKETVKRMNAGMTEREIIHDIDYPAEIFHDPLMSPEYGTPEFIVRDIWRSENGWWDRNATNLHPADPDSAARAIREAIADPEYVLRKAQAHRENGDPQLALHVLDLLATTPDGDEISKRARFIKAEILQQLSQTATSVVSKQLYVSESENLMKADRI